MRLAHWVLLPLRLVFLGRVGSVKRMRFWLLQNLHFSLKILSRGRHSLNSLSRVVGICLILVDISLKSSKYLVTLNNLIPLASFTMVSLREQVVPNLLLNASSAYYSIVACLGFTFIILS
jgi:hypothetical protein